MTGLTRSEESAERSARPGRRGGGRRRLRRAERSSGAVAGAAPEVVVHAADQPARATQPAQHEEAYEANNRVRGEGNANLLAAARAAGARRLVAQSIAFLYAPEGDPVKDEDAPR